MERAAYGSPFLIRCDYMDISQGVINESSGHIGNVQGAIWKETSRNKRRIFTWKSKFTREA